MAAMTDGGHIVSTGTLAREREKFFDLLRTKYPEHGKGIEDFLSVDDTVLDKVQTYTHKRQYFFGGRGKKDLKNIHTPFWTFQYVYTQT